MKSLSLRVLVGLITIAAATHVTAVTPGPPAPTSSTDAARIASLLEQMRTADLAALPALPLEPYTLPPAGVDVMRVKMEETYDVAGVGRDTVELTGWIAAKHDNARPAFPGAAVQWGTGIVDTEFVGLELQGTSDIFGPVRVHLDTSFPSIGQVGRLSIPFPIQIGLERAYAGVRPVAATPPSPLQPAPQPPRPEQPRLTGQQLRVLEVMQKLWDAIKQRDARAMARLYARSGNTLFFGTGRTGIHSTVDEYAKAIQRQFEGVQSIEVAPDRSRIDIRVVGRVAFVSATGKNTVVDTSGRTASNDWRATVRLEQQSNNAWLITQDHISFNPAGVPAVDPSALSCCGHCLARIRVNVDMPTLALRMKADDPVLWYSEVDTIPPVGYTASVSLTPTRLSSGGRAVATLRHGTVKFREIVKQIRLDGTQWGAGAPAAR